MTTLSLDLGMNSERLSRYAAFGGTGDCYRYELGRSWSGGYDNSVLFIGLNPSTADGETDDPTIRRCIAFARAWGYGSLRMANLFAYRATDPADMMRAAAPVGSCNDATIILLAAQARLIVACWGAHGTYSGRDREVRRLVPRLHHLGLTKEGQPRHPLYLPGGTVPQLWETR